MRVRECEVLFDDEDAALLSEYQWHIHETRTNLYIRGYRKGLKRRETKVRYLHRVLMQPPPHKDVDHINGNSLDNRRSNLRVCSRSQNNANKHFVVSAVGVKGVYFEKWSGRYRAEIQKDGRRYRLGRFTALAEAKAAYLAKARELFGEFAAG